MYITKKDKINYFKKEISNVTTISLILKEFLDIDAPGGGGKTSCPFHSDSSPSFSINKADNMYKCFSCGSKGKAAALLFEANEKRLLKKPDSLSIPQKYDIFLLNLANYLKIPHNYNGMEDEVTDDNIVDQIETILGMQKNRLKIMPAEQPTLNMRFNTIKRRFKLGILSEDELLKVLVQLQHEEVENPTNMDELFSSLKMTVGDLSLEDLMED